MALYDFVDQDPNAGSPYSRPRPVYPAGQDQQAIRTNYLQSGPQPGFNVNGGDPAQMGAHGDFLHQAVMGVGSYIDGAGQWLWDHVSGKDNPASFDEDVTQARGRLEARAHARPMMTVPTGTTVPSNGATSPAPNGTTVPTPARGTGMGQLSDFGRLALKAMSQGLGEDPETVYAAHDNFTKLTGRFPTPAELADFKSLGMLGQLAGANIDTKRVSGPLRRDSDLYSAMFDVPGVRLPYLAQQIIGKQLFTPAMTYQGVSNLLRAGVSAGDIRKMAAAIGGVTGEHITSFLPPAQQWRRE